MYICICNAITDRQIRDAARAGVSNLWQLQKDLGVASGCGKCREAAVDILRQDTAESRTSKPSRHGAGSV